ncbi:lytic transglycosylase domain-containing protein [Desulforhopalus vacuolatus]|nr:lytic transglycosylase domain-containing protein [Desulforhopalus vacuolatus]
MGFSSHKRGTKKYDSEISSIATRYGVDPSLIKAIIHVESGFNHRAVSRMGARGLMQLMPGTARELKVYNPFNAKQNIDGGTRYFRQIMDDFNGDVRLALAAYNAGPGLVHKLHRIPAIPETRNYVRKVMRMYRFYKSGAI